jgi:hypothetical protein
MLQRGDRHHDIAAWFGVNQGRIADVKAGDLFPEVSPARPAELPPQGSPGRIALISMRTLREARKSLETALSCLARQPDEEETLEATQNIDDALEEIDSALKEIDKEQE